MDERRLGVRTVCAALLLWLASAGAALADPPSKEFWPEIDTWLRLSPAWRLSVFVPVSENLDTHYREGNLILQADCAWAESNRTRRLIDGDRAQNMQIWLLRGVFRVLGAVVIEALPAEILTDIQVGDRVLSIQTQPLSVKGGTGTGAKKMVGGTMLGAAIGAIAGGGKGAAIGAGDVKAAVIPAQSPQAFTLAVPLEVDIMTNVAVR